MTGFCARLTLLVTAITLLAGCGRFKPFVEGWRDHDREARTDQQKCEAMKGYQWINGTCQKKGSLNLDGVGEAECKKIDEAVWKNDKCMYFRDLASADDCASVGWSWYQDQCMLPAQAQCLADPANDWAADHCVVRPTIGATGASATQTLTIGAKFAPLTISLSASAVPSLENETCAGFFVIEVDKVTSKPAVAEQTCEADLYATFEGAKSKPVHLKATVDKGFLSFCKQFRGDVDAQRKDPGLARTVLALLNASQKADCDEAATALASATSFDMSRAGITDLRPLAGFTQIRDLNLANNPKLADLSPIARLTNLEVLILDNTYLDLYPSKRTEANCPTGDDVAFLVWSFCGGED